MWINYVICFDGQFSYVRVEIHMEASPALDTTGRSFCEPEEPGGFSFDHGEAVFKAGLAFMA